MSKKIAGVVAFLGMCALSLFLLNCGSSSQRPSGLLYVLTQGTSGTGLPGIGYNVSSFSINFNTGSLSLINSNASTCPSATVTNNSPCGLPLDILVDPTGATAFVLNQGVPCVQEGTQCVSGANGLAPPSIYPYNVNSDGSLSAPVSPVYWTCLGPSGTACTQASASADTAVAMARDATGNFLFVIDQGVDPAPATCPEPKGAAAANSAQATAYRGCPSISVFAMKPGSTSLTFVSQSATYQSPLYLSKIPSALSVIPFTPPGSSSSQELLFVTNNFDLIASEGDNNTLSVFTVGSAGALTEQSYSPFVVSFADPISVLAVNTNPTGENTGGVFVYVGNQDSDGGHLNPFQICTEVNLTDCPAEDVTNDQLVPLATCPQITCVVAPTTAGSIPIQMVVDPTNNFLYVISQGSDQVFAFHINTTAGTLTALTPANQPTGSQPVSIAVQPSVNNLGQFLYVSNSTSNNISGFAISTTSGTMSSPITVIAPAAPSGIAVH